MGKQNKKLLDNIDKFNSDDWQGRSKQQVENNEFLSAVSVLGLIGLSIILAIISYI